MDKIKTASGKEFECEFVSEIREPSRLYLRIYNTTLATVAAVFGNSEETVQLWWGDFYFAQYTHLVAIVPEMEAVRVILAKE